MNAGMNGGAAPVRHCRDCVRGGQGVARPEIGDAALATGPLALAARAHPATVRAHRRGQAAPRMGNRSPLGCPTLISWATNLVSGHPRSLPARGTRYGSEQTSVKQGPGSDNRAPAGSLQDVPVRFGRGELNAFLNCEAEPPTSVLAGVEDPPATEELRALAERLRADSGAGQKTG
jgi:hypothetical protein